MHIRSLLYSKLPHFWTLISQSTKGLLCYTDAAKTRWLINDEMPLRQPSSGRLSEFPSKADNLSSFCTDASLKFFCLLLYKNKDKVICLLSDVISCSLSVMPWAKWHNGYFSLNVCWVICVYCLADTSSISKNGSNFKTTSYIFCTSKLNWPLWLSLSLLRYPKEAHSVKWRSLESRQYLYSTSRVAYNPWGYSYMFSNMLLTN